MTLNQLYYFRELAETGHMGRAAAKLYISQPSLSVAISNLEKELGLALFDREGHRTALSPEGAAFLVHVRKILTETEEAKQHMQRLSEKSLNSIRIGSIEPLFRDYIPSMIREFSDIRGNEHIAFNLSSEMTSELIRMLKNGLFDFVLCSRSDDYELVQYPVLSQPLVLIGPESPGNVPKTKEELQKEPLIGYDIRSAMAKELDELIGDSHITLRAPDEDSIASLVENGFGWAIVPKVKCLETHRISIYPYCDAALVRKVYLTCQKGRTPKGAAGRFAEFLKSSTM